MAANLGGVAHDRVTRGDALVRPGQWHLSAVADARLEVLATLDHAVSRKGAYHVYIGSGEYPAQLRLLGAGTGIEPGHSDAVRLHLPVALPLLLIAGAIEIRSKKGLGRSALR